MTHVPAIPTGQTEPVADHRPPSSHELIREALYLTSTLELGEALRAFVDTSRQLTGARYAALGILDSRGETEQFIFSGMSMDRANMMDGPPHGHGVFAQIPTDDALIINDVNTHPAFEGWPEHHPRMTSFLGAPVRIKEQVFGRLYLTDKEGGFTEEDAENVQMLAIAAGISVQNARLYGESTRRAAWIAASQAITTALLEGTDEEEALELIAVRMREVAEADVSLIVLPSVGDSWVCEIADGDGASDLIGTKFPYEGRAQTVIREGTGVVVNSMLRQRTLRVPELRKYGPALYAPMVAQGTGLGVIILMRGHQAPEFDLSDLAMAESVAKQATLALQLAAARHAQDVAAQTDERARIGRDLHDLAIQQLFGTGMKITAIREDLERQGVSAEAVELLNQAISSVDESVRQIRGIVHSLREPDANVVLVERLRREASLARSSLGFAPSLLIELDGVVLDVDAEDDSATEARIDDVVGADIADDVVATCREGLANAARHARASSVTVSLTVVTLGENAQVTVCVADDGGGPSPAITRRSGLANLAARARRHGGCFSLRPRHDGNGAVLTWSVPLQVHTDV